MVSSSPVRDDLSDVIATVADRLGRDQVFGPPVQSGDATLVPVARLRAGGGVARLRGPGEGRLRGRRGLPVAGAEKPTLSPPTLPPGSVLMSATRSTGRHPLVQLTPR